MTVQPEIDARGLLCPLPVLRLRKALLPMPPGARAVLIATDPAAIIDVPHFCAEGGHRLLDMQDRPDGARAYTVERGPAPLQDSQTEVTP